MSEHPSTPTGFNAELTWKRFVLRSILPLAAVLLLLSTLVIGPYGFAAAVVIWWLLQRRF